jgi:hypothetical protein
MRTALRVTVYFLMVLAMMPRHADAQTFTTDDPVLQRIWELGMEQSRATDLAQVLMDSIGPRLTGSPGQLAAHDWAANTYLSWGVDAENEEYGTWTGWRRGIHHVDLTAPTREDARCRGAGLACQNRRAGRGQRRVASPGVQRLRVPSVAAAGPRQVRAYCSGAPVGPAGPRLRGVRNPWSPRAS